MALTAITGAAGAGASFAVGSAAQHRRAGIDPRRRGLAMRTSSESIRPRHAEAGMASPSECLTPLLSVLCDQGHATCDLDLPFDQLARALGRPGEPEEILPRLSSESRPGSLSARYGCHQFPWHSDGAVALQPPRWILLRAVRMHGTSSTELLDPSSEVLAALRRTVLRTTPASGGVRYLPAYVPTGTNRYRLRWDLSKATPSRLEAERLISIARPTAKVEWREGRTLIFDNERILHRRPGVSPTQVRVLERIYVWSDA